MNPDRDIVAEALAEPTKFPFSRVGRIEFLKVGRRMILIGYSKTASGSGLVYASAEAGLSTPKWISLQTEAEAKAYYEELIKRYWETAESG